MQLYWLTAIFGGYDKARIWHFWPMWLFILFVVPMWFWFSPMGGG